MFAPRGPTTRVHYSVVEYITGMGGSEDDNVMQLRIMTTTSSTVTTESH